VLPGAKQVFREEEHGTAMRDTIASAEERLPGRPLLQAVMRNGKRLPAGTTTLDESRAYAASQLRSLPERLLRNSIARPPYPVVVSAELRALHAEVSRAVHESPEVAE
jgi:nicotinate phosphoribosyltransferase